MKFRLGSLRRFLPGDAGRQVTDDQRSEEFPRHEQFPKGP